MQRNPVGWFEIYVQDMARARRFYEAVLGVTLTPLNSVEPQLWQFPGHPAAPGASPAPNASAKVCGRMISPP